ncbi:MAG: segregation/condensation protein A [Bacilli bacterium]|nr:segregation/condensation protein A [Bacilli bacterium]
MDYKIKTLDFEGPLDLLLHLVKQADIDIFEINIAEITNQYLFYINQMESFDLNIDSEYLVMAADLIEIKARELLPIEKEEEEEENPKEELINRLVEYQRYKEISSEFKSLESERQLLYSKEQSFFDEYKDDSLKLGEDISIDDLIKAFAKFQERKNFEKPLNTVVTRKEYSVHKRSREILERIKSKKKINFDELFDVYTRDYVVVTFLSILDLARKGQILIKQDNNLDKIVLQSKGEVV